MIRTVLDEHKMWWYEVNDRDARIQKIINQLDELALHYEAVWGVGFLRDNCSDELAQKWDLQVENMEKALQEQNEQNVEKLAMGFLRAYPILEADVYSRNHLPLAPAHMAIEHNGVEIIIAANNCDVSKMAIRKPNQGARIYTMSQIAKLLDGNLDNLVDVIEKREDQEKKKSKRLNFGQRAFGPDEIPWAQGSF